MYEALLSVLLLGMVPLASSGAAPESTSRLGVAAPAELVAVQQRLSASGVVIMDLDSGQRLYSRQATVRRPMASITKLMTALLVVEHHGLDEVVTISRESAAVEGTKAHLVAGEQYRVGDLLSALLISSANDAADALARHHSGTPSAFVSEMNARAERLGLRSTLFANPSGLDDPDQWSTPQDIAWLAAFALQNAEIRERLGSASRRIVSVQGHPLALTHTHALIHTQSTVLAGKTGTTEGAGQCLMSLVEQGGRRYLVVLLHSLQRYGDMRTILASLPEGSTALSSTISPSVASSDQGNQ